MNNSKIKSLVTLFIISTIAFSACEKDEQTEPDEQPEPEFSNLPIIPEPIGPGPVTRHTSDTVIVEYSAAIDNGYFPFEVDCHLYADTFGCNEGEGYRTRGALGISYGFDTSEAVYKIRHRRYWKKIYSNVLGPGTSFSEAKEYTRGTSMTNAEEFSASISATAGGFGFGISATLSAKFSKSVTINEEEKSTITRSVTGADGVDRVFTIWQLRDIYDIVDPLNNPVPTPESLIKRLGGIDKPELIDHCINRMLNRQLTFHHETSSFPEFTYSAEENTKDKWCTDRITILNMKPSQYVYHYLIDNGTDDTFLHTKDFER